jgi:hypothetical protein
VIVVDSSVWINYFNGFSSPEVERLDDTIGADLIVVGMWSSPKCCKAFAPMLTSTQRDQHWRL